MIINFPIKLNQCLRNKNHKNGRWETTYHFFQKKAGEDFTIIPGETLMVEMIQEMP